MYSLDADNVPHLPLQNRQFQRKRHKHPWSQTQIALEPPFVVDQSNPSSSSGRAINPWVNLFQLQFGVQRIFDPQAYHHSYSCIVWWLILLLLTTVPIVALFIFFWTWSQNKSFRALKELLSPNWNRGKINNNVVSRQQTSSDESPNI